MSSRIRWCNKCKVAEAHPEDSWCHWCSSLERLADLSRARFASPAYRFFASEIVFQALRQVQGVLTLDRRSQGALESARKSAKRQDWHQGVKPPSAQGRAGDNPPEVAPKKEARQSREREDKGGRVKLEENQEGRREESPDYGQDSETPSEKSDHRREGRRSSGSQKPPEPAHPPEGWSEGKATRRRSRSRGRRGGTKHQGKHRGLEDPGKVFHNRLKFDHIPLGGKWGSNHNGRIPAGTWWAWQG